MIRFVTRLLLAALLLPFGAAQAAADAILPADSLYRLEAEFSDQQGHAFQLADRRGRPQLVAMFYTSCRFVCPLIIDSAKGVENALTPAERERLDVLLVSIDPARDDTAALAAVANKRRLDPRRWTLARAGESGVRKFAALLGVRYRALADGEYNHTSTLYLLDADGRKLASTGTLGPTPDPEFVAAVRKLLETQ